MLKPDLIPTPAFRRWTARSLCWALAAAAVFSGCKQRDSALKSETPFGPSDRVDLLTYQGSVNPQVFRAAVDTLFQQQELHDDYEYWRRSVRDMRQTASPQLADFLRLDDAELMGIRIYTGSAYRAINRLLRSYPGLLAAGDAGAGAASASLENWRPVILAAASGLNKLPLIDAGKRCVVRGAQLDPDKIERYRQAAQTGDKLTELGFTSTAAQADVLESFEGNVKFVIKHKRGHSVAAISEFPDEREVLFVPGSDFRVTKVEDKDRANPCSVWLSDAQPFPTAPPLPGAQEAAVPDNSGRDARAGTSSDAIGFVNEPANGSVSATTGFQLQHDAPRVVVEMEEL